MSEFGEMPPIPTAGWEVFRYNWEVVSSANINDIEPNCGSVLVGPHAKGVQAVIPPHVWAYTPEGSEPSISRAGWRHSIWPNYPAFTTPDTDKNWANVVFVTLDERPIRHTVLPDLVSVVGLVKAVAGADQRTLRFIAKTHWQFVHNQRSWDQSHPSEERMTPKLIDAAKAAFGEEVIAVKLEAEEDYLSSIYGGVLKTLRGDGECVR